MRRLREQGNDLGYKEKSQGLWNDRMRARAHGNTTVASDDGNNNLLCEGEVFENLSDERARAGDIERGYTKDATGIPK
jgi:hypothetical protein